MDEEGRSRENTCKSKETRKDSVSLRKAVTGCRAAMRPRGSGGQLLCSWTPFLLTVMDAAPVSVLLLQFILRMQSWSKIP